MTDEFDADEGGALVVQDQGGALAAVVKSEAEAQLVAAHRFPRSVGKALSGARALATHNPHIAESCGYLLTRSGKPIVGPSVRLAEIVATSWGNLRVGASVIEDTGTEIVARGVCWDLESNLQASTEVRRSVMTSAKDGRIPKRFQPDMVSVVANAACSIARRNAILQVVPRSVVEDVYGAAMAVATGEGKPMAERRENAMKALAGLGATKADVLRKLGRQTIEDMTAEDLEVLSAIRSGLKSGELKLAEAFAIEATLEPENSAAEVIAAAARRGRPPGSKNRPKEPAAEPPATELPAPTFAEFCAAIGRAGHALTIELAAVVETIADEDVWIGMPESNRRDIFARVAAFIPEAG